MSEDKISEKEVPELNTQKEKNSNPYLIPGAIVIAGIFIAIAVISTKGEGVAPAQTEVSAEVMPITKSDHILGPKKPDVYFIEYSDYRCGYCGIFHTTLEKIIEEYDGRVAWVYRHTPYQSGGKEAAVASECIADQLGEEAFWAYTESAFANQKSLSDKWNKEKAVELGVNGDVYEECVSSGKFDELISEQTKNSQELGGRGTPFNVLLTKDGGVIKFSGAQPIENVRVFVNRALNSLD